MAGWILEGSRAQGAWGAAEPEPRALVGMRLGLGAESVPVPGLWPWAGLSDPPSMELEGT